MKSFLSNKFLLLIIRYVVGFIFIYAGMEKITNPSDFAISISNYKLLPSFLIGLTAILLPWIEVIAGLLMILGIAVKETAVIINSMLLIFIIAIGISLARGLNIDCGCFGKSGGSELGLLKILENSLMFCAGLLLIFFDSTLLSLSSENGQS